MHADANKFMSRRSFPHNLFFIFLLILLPFRTPQVTEQWGSVIFHTVLISPIVAVISLSIVIKFSMQFKYEHEVDPNQEMIAMGASSLFGSIFQTNVSCGSLSRSAVLADAGAKTNAASLFQVLIVVLCLTWVTSLLTYIADAVLAAIILVAFTNIFAQLSTSLDYYRRDKADFVVWMVTYVKTLFTLSSFFVSLSLSLSLSFLSFFFAGVCCRCVLARDNKSPSLSVWITRRVGFILPRSTAHVITRFTAIFMN
jgi:MFS superfamily sulfate permease-like transporter